MNKSMTESLRTLIVLQRNLCFDRCPFFFATNHMSIAITSYERIKQSKKKPSQKQHERLDRFWQQMMNTNMQTLRRGKGGAYKRRK
ncbi:Hypothetical protein A7A1_0025 [Bacillus subtilis subsp. subtilis str. BSP1]|nr:Hypothetical protein A7A1_0025 [Bacillus subtilis subsp. subtilis str. BSP1]